MPRTKPSILAEPKRNTFSLGTQEIPSEQGKGRIPGYAGFIPKAQHVAGVTYGNMTRSTISPGFKVAASEVALPPSPNRSGGKVGRPGYHVPGYTGHVAGKMDLFSSTYGGMTRACDPKGIVGDNGQLPDVTTGSTVTESIGTNEQPSSLFMSKGDAQAIFKATTTGQIPGYCGFVRGGQHVAGSTYGALTRAAQGEDFSGKYNAALPAYPHRNVSPRGNQPGHKLPGYTGFVPGKRETFSTTYGETTTKLRGHTPVSPSKVYINRTNRSWDGVGGANEASKIADRARKTDQAEAKLITGEGRVPGYGGFVRGAQHHSATTFGKMTTNTNESDFSDYESPSLLPDSPQRQRYQQVEQPKHKIPGYTGFVPNTRESYATTYGRTTAAVHHSR